MREINKDDLNLLPKKYGVGANKNKLIFDWTNCKGYKLRFVYEDIKGIIEIVGYDSKNAKLTIKYLEDQFRIYSGHLLQCKLGNIIKKITKDFKLKVGIAYKNDKRDLIITDREYRTHLENGWTINRKWYKYKCNVCKWSEGWIIEADLLFGYGCSCCNGKVVVKGINDIPTTAPWMIKYFKDGYNDAKMYMKSSNSKINPVCPDCKRIKKQSMKINTIYQRKSICCSCSDGLSYPEKFVMSMLDQLKVDYLYQLSKTTFNWCNNYKYDLYIPSNNTIIEIHGLQHFEEGFKNFRKRGLKEEQENDVIKQELAINNGISNYIVIDARKSQFEWIKRSIINSAVSDLPGFKTIDWLECEKFALSNLVKIACNIKRNNPNFTTTDIGKIMKLHGTTIKRYLEQGTKFGWCSYDRIKEISLSSKKGSKSRTKKVIVIKDNKEIGVFNSGRELASLSEEMFNVKFTVAGISAACIGKTKTYKGYTLKFTNQMESDEIV